MGISSGSFSVRRFKLLSSPHSQTFSDIFENLQKAIIDPLLANDSRELAFGFCHPFSGEPVFSEPHSLVYGDTFVFGFRVDTKKIPAVFLRLQLKMALESIGFQMQADGEKKKKKSFRKTKDELKSRLKEELIKLTLPSIKIIEVLWDMSAGEVLLLSSSQSLSERFEQLFLEIFSERLVPINAGTIPIDFERVQLGLQTNLKPLLDLSPVLFFNEGHV